MRPYPRWLAAMAGVNALMLVIGTDDTLLRSIWVFLFGYYVTLFDRETRTASP